MSGALLDALVNARHSGEAVALVSVIVGPGTGAQLLVFHDRVLGRLAAEGLQRAVLEEARAMLRQGQTGARRYGPEGERRRQEVTVFIHSFAPPAQMYVFGAIDFAAAVASMGKFLGYRVTVCDARPVFATRDRFPTADEVVVAWPDEFLRGAAVDERTAICVLTHDPKFDIPVLQVALSGPAGYIAALGSRRTHAIRVERLREAGLGEQEIARVAGPAGLDIGAATPEETAVAIAAEIIALRAGRGGRRLAETDGPIHSRR